MNVSVRDAFPQGWPLGGMDEPGSSPSAAEEPHSQQGDDVDERRLAPQAARLTAAGGTPIDMRQGQGVGRPAAPVRRFVTVDTGLAALERARHNVHRAIAGAVSEYLQRAATYLRGSPNVDVLLLGAARTAEVIEALDDGARQLGAVLPDDLADAAQQLRQWAATVKSPWPDREGETLPASTRRRLP